MQGKDDCDQLFSFFSFALVLVFKEVFFIHQQSNSDINALELGRTKIFNRISCGFGRMYVNVEADDFGWGNVGYHNHDNVEVDTPTINRLVKQGVELDRFYS